MHLHLGHCKIWRAFKSFKIIFIKRTLLDTLNVLVINCFFVTYLSVKKNNGVTVLNSSTVANIFAFQLFQNIL